MNKKQLQNFSFLLGLFCAVFSPTACAQNQSSQQSLTVKQNGIAAFSKISSESPAPSPGKQSVNSVPFLWAEQGVSIDLPAGSEKLYEKPTGFSWIKKDKSQNAADAQSDAIWFSGVVNVSSKQEVFQGMTFKDALDYEYNDNLKQQREGKYTEVRWHTIDGVKGILSVEASENDPLDQRNLTWKCYRVHKGVHQLIGFSAYTSNRAFDKHKDEMQRLLFSLKLTQ